MALPQFLGTTEVPPQYWKAANLIGPTPFMACSYDQRASYCMYIPEAHYKLNLKARLPLIVNVHSSNRRAERCRDSLVDLANRVGAAVLAPLFPAAIQDSNDSHNYKLLRYKDIRYDLVLLSMVDEVAKRWPGIETAKFFLIGFSGGGQFVSRFFYLHPERLEAVSIGAPGLATSLEDTSLEWPRGLKHVEQHFEGLTVDVHALKLVLNVQLIIGENDVQEPSNGLLGWLAQKDRNNPLSAVIADLPHRTDSMVRLRDELLSNGVNVQYDVVPGVAHEAMKLLPTVIEFLESVLKHR